MASISAIISAIDEFLEKNKLKTTTPVEVSPYLERKGILNNSSDRPGSPLRTKLRNGLIPHAWQDGSNWIIPHSSRNRESTSIAEKKYSSKKTGLKMNTPSNDSHKLAIIGQLVCQFLKENFGEKPVYLLEHKPEWLLSYPSTTVLEANPQIQELYSRLVNEPLDLKELIQNLPPKKLAQEQSYDIWIGAPFNFAVEFDEKQHFNQYRRITLDYYQDVQVNYSLPLYLELTKNIQSKPGTSGFTTLKSSDPLFPPALPGPAQDNRIRQRAFRDYLKDLLPVVHGQNPTLRIPFHITNKKVREFSEDHLKAIKDYLRQVDLQL